MAPNLAQLVQPLPWSAGLNLARPMFRSGKFPFELDRRLIVCRSSDANAMVRPLSTIVFPPPKRLISPHQRLPLAALSVKRPIGAVVERGSPRREEGRAFHRPATRSARRTHGPSLRRGGARSGKRPGSRWAANHRKYRLPALYCCRACPCRWSCAASAPTQSSRQDCVPTERFPVELSRGGRTSTGAYWALRRSPVSGGGS